MPFSDKDNELIKNLHQYKEYLRFTKADDGICGDNMELDTVIVRNNHQASPKFYMRHVTYIAPLFVDLYSCILDKLSICIGMPNFKSVAVHVLEICLRVCQIL